MSQDPLKAIVDCAAGRMPADVLLEGGRIVNVASNEIIEADLALLGDTIVGWGTHRASVTVDLKGRYICPGFWDAHLHIESSLLSVPEFARTVSRFGTTSVVADPHEFANVAGVAGIEYVLTASDDLPIDVFVMLSSCVPASPLESAGATLEAEDLRPFLRHPRVLGLAEVMNYPGVIAGNREVLEKIAMARDKVIDGHAPSVSGAALTAYAASGIQSDHECTTAAEAMEKLRAGLHVMIREGAQARNLTALAPLVRPEIAHRFMFCTDDKDADHILREGHIDHILRSAVKLGMDPMLAVRLATLNPATYFRRARRGAVLPGYVADLAIVEDLKSFRVTDVFHRGRHVVSEGAFTGAQDVAPSKRSPLSGTMSGNSVHVRPLRPADFTIKATGASPPTIRVIHVLENRIDTEQSFERATVRDGALAADPTRDLAKIVVVDRHHASGDVGRGFVRGFELRSGAIGSTVAHDAHNLIVVGMTDADMLAAASRLIELGGGLVAVDGGRVLAELPLPIAGLVSDLPAETVAEKMRLVSHAARSLGCPLQQPFMALSFLSLSVIGKLKLTTHGLVDVAAFRVVPLTGESDAGG